MASQITNYQCPSCTGPLRFDGASGKLQCDYCGSSFTIAEIEKIYQDKLEEAGLKDTAYELLLKISDKDAPITIKTETETTQTKRLKDYNKKLKGGK